MDGCWQMVGGRVAAAALVAAIVLGALAGAAAAQEGCRADRLGNTVCRDLPRPAPEVRPGRGAVEPEERRERLTIPGWRRDAFGTVRPERQAVTGGRPFGQRPRPELPARLCRADSLGNVVCR